MSALAADPVSPRKAPLAASTNRQVVNTAVMYKDALVALCSPTHATAASRGRVKPWSGAAGEILLGRWGQGKTTGDTGAAALVNGQVQYDDQVVESVLCAGLAASEFQRDMTKWVYCATDNLVTDLTLTQPAAPNDQPVGIVWQGVSATRCDVLLFGFLTKFLMDLMAGGGSGIQTISLGVLSAALAGSGNMLTGIPMSFHGQFLSVFAICTNPPTDADFSISVNLEIDGTNVTGGVVTLLHGDTQGLQKSGTAVTAAAEFHRGSLLDVEGVVNTATTSTDVGAYNLYATVQSLPGL